MSETRATVCVGGPLNGSLYVPFEPQDKFPIQVTNAPQVPLLDGDQTIGEFQYVHQQWYYLEHFVLQWATGAQWVYAFWTHESLRGSPAEIIDLLHLSACAVTRTLLPVAQLSRPYFQYGNEIIILN